MTNIAFLAEVTLVYNVRTDGLIQMANANRRFPQWLIVYSTVETAFVSFAKKALL